LRAAQGLTTQQMSFPKKALLLDIRYQSKKLTEF